ncbi:MAG: hypothetical protein WCJ13_01895 [Coriobacteriia bacterium]
MSEETQSNNQQMIVIALVVIATLLAAIVGVVIWQQSKAATTLPSPTATGAPAATGGAAAGAAGTAGGAPAGMGGAAGGAPAAAGPFDAKTATKVPGGMTPEQLLKTYGDDILANKYADAYKMLPLDKQQYYVDAAGYENTLKGYGITAFNMGKPVTDGDKITINSEQVTPQMSIFYTWTFKKVGGQWYVESRTAAQSLN